jgi:peptidoglycan/LPS O-acetylase OafA/YrhL
LLIPYAIVFPAVSPTVVDGSWQTFFAWPALLDNLLLINAMNQHNYLSWNIVAWSIGAEWWAYVAACLLIPFIYQKSWWRWVLISFAAFYTLIALVHHKGNLDITFDYGWMRCLASFCMGAVLYQVYLKKIGKTWLAMNVSVLLSLLFIVSIFHFRWPDLLVIPVFCLLILSAAWNDGAVKNILESKPLRYLGDISYSIYMMHGVWFMVFWFCLPYLRTTYGIQQFTGWMIMVYGFLFVALTLFSAHFTYQYIELKGKLLFKRLASK